MNMWSIQHKNSVLINLLPIHVKWPWAHWFGVLKTTPDVKSTKKCNFRDAHYFIVFICWMNERCARIQFFPLSILKEAWKCPSWTLNTHGREYKCLRKGWTNNTKILLVESKSWPNFPLVKGPRLERSKILLGNHVVRKMVANFWGAWAKGICTTKFPGGDPTFCSIEGSSHGRIWINFYLGLGSLSQLASNSSYDTICIKLA